MSSANPFLLAFVLLVASLGLMSSAPVAQVICALIPLVAVALLWPPGGLPLLLMPVGIQWLQIATKPIAAGIQGVPISMLSDRGATLEPGFMAASLGLMALAIGLRLGAGRALVSVGAAFRRDVKGLGDKELYKIVAVFFAISYVSEILSGLAEGLRQLLLGAAAIKLSAIFILVSYAIITRRGRLLALIVIVVETVLGLTGFFSEYRLILIVAFIGVLAAAPRIKSQTLAAACVLIVATLLLTIFWSAVKPSYRTFVNRGSATQVVDRSISERITYLGEAATKFDGEQFADGVRRLVDRISYIEFLSFALDGAQYSGNQGGEQTLNAIFHILVPRLIYPDKPALANDTQTVARYTGLQFQSGEAASISLGYVGEFFGDFGWVGVLLGPLVLGMLIGRACKLLITYKNGSLPINAGLSIVPLVAVLLFETALIKVLGGMITGLIAALLLQRVILPRLFFQSSSSRPYTSHRRSS